MSEVGTPTSAFGGTSEQVFEIWNFAEIAQVVERRPEKPGVASASLALGTLLRSNVFTFELRRSASAKLPNESLGA